MNEKSVLFVFVLLISLSFLSVGVLAANSTAFLEEVEEEYGEVELVDGGLTPEDGLYFVDEFFDRFGDEVQVKEEKFAEYLALVESGNEVAAQEALEKYNEYADRLEKEIDPGQREDARRSAAAIKHSLKDREGDFDDILEREEKVVTAVEIAGKIQDLCRDLAELDPNAYYETCKVEGDGPDWQKKLDKDLTADQKKIAKEFIGVMKQCFKTSGQECRCEEIPFTDFADACSEAAPLAIACDVNGDEEACEELDDLEMPELPPYLQEIFEEMDGGEMEEARYEMHMPFECVDAGITDPRECGKYMITEFSPPECRDALLEADVQNEWEGRKICDEIMMEVHAPECAKEGITDPRECEKFMYDIGNRPPECQSNGIHDLRDCKRFLEEGGTYKVQPNYGRDCKSLEDPLERLECYDSASIDSGMRYDEGPGFQGSEEEFREIKEKERECADKCGRENKAWDFTGGNCVCRENPYGDYGKPQDDYWKGYDCAALDCQQGFHCEPDFGCVSDGGEQGTDQMQSECSDGCQDECPGASGTNCVDGGSRCECFYEEESSSEEEPTSSQEEVFNEPEEEVVEESSTEDAASEEVEEEVVEDSSAMGMTGNAFLDYYFD
jgi:polyhydroxyalkanoate synthesis regulator phasin